MCKSVDFQQTAKICKNIKRYWNGFLMGDTRQLFCKKYICMYFPNYLYIYMSDNRRAMVAFPYKARKEFSL